MIHPKRRSRHPKTVNFKFVTLFVQTLHSKIDISHQKLDQLSVFCYTPLSEIAKKLGNLVWCTLEISAAH